ncbi:MAG: SDR family oxidoreductase [Coriobacteriia bacterium]|nr:SDR family oxidoreductase [Coriobacteriia bacterium]
MKIGIVGASGKLGSLVLDHLLELVPAEDVVAMTRSVDKLAAYAERGVDVREADYDVPETLEAAFAGVEKLLIVPSMAMPAERREQYDNAVSAARAAGVQHLLTFTMSGTSPGNPFVMTPALVYAEMSLFKSRLAWTILRNGPYADEFVDWLPGILELGTVPYPTGDGKAGYVARNDIARAAAAVLADEGHEGKIHNLVGPELLTTKDLCALVAEATGKHIVYVPAEPGDYVQVCTEEGVPEELAVVLATMYIAIAQHLMEVPLGAIEKLTGTPPKSMRELLAERVAAG